MKIKKEMYEEFLQIADIIINNEVFCSQKKFIQHGKTTTYEHVILVAIRAFKMGYNFKIDKESLVIGALLHDFYLYDWHTFKPEKLHGFYHPKLATINASKYFKVNNKIINIIKSHMWPLTIFLIPKCTEAWIVNICDKYQSLLEILKLNRGIKICCS